MTALKRQKESMEEKLNEEMKAKDVIIENLRDKIAENNHQYQENTKKMKAQHIVEGEEIRRQAQQERDALITKFQSSAFVSQLLTKAEYEQLKKSKVQKVNELVSAYESQISETVLHSKEQLDIIANDYESKLKTREECFQSLQSVLFSVESDYSQSLTHQLEDYYDTLKTKELHYKSDLMRRVNELLEALEASKLQNEQISRQLDEEMSIRTRAEAEAEEAAGIRERYQRDAAQWRVERESLTKAMEEATESLVAKYEGSIQELKSQLVRATATSQTSHAVSDGLHRASKPILCYDKIVLPPYLALQSTVTDVLRQHQQLTSELSAKYEAKMKALRAEMKAIDTTAESTPSSSSASDGDRLQVLQREHESLTERLVSSYESQLEALRSELAEAMARNDAVTVNLRNSSYISSPTESSVSSAIATPLISPMGAVQETALAIQKKENKVLQERIAVLERRIEGMMRLPSRRFQLSGTDRSSLAKIEESSESKQAVPVEDASEKEPIGVVEGATQEVGHADAPPSSQPFSEEAANQAIEELEVEVYNLRLELAELEAQNNVNAAERKALAEQLDALIKEKRTDVVAQFEEDIKSLRNELLVNKEILATLKEEKLKNETRIKELKERAEKAETELKERDELEIKALNPSDEKTILKDTVAKQREDIIMKSKAATAGWDAAASADKRLDIDVEKAYQKGLTEAANRHSLAMSALNESIEKKETRITELLVSLAAAERSRKELEDQLAEAKEQAAAASRGFGGYTEEGELEVSPYELQEARDNLDLAHEEVADLSTRLEHLQASLDLANKKISLYDKLIAASLTAPASASENNAQATASTPSADLRDVIASIKNAVIEVRCLHDEYYALIIV